jgi:acyl dehydratase
MALDPDYLFSLPPIETRQQWSARDTILYALGVGVGAQTPTDPDELQFVFEDRLRTLPTMAVVMAYPGYWAREPKYRLDWKRSLHGEQSLEIHAPLPTQGALYGVTSFDAVYDKGADKGALLYSSRRIFQEGVEAPIATVRQCSFLRGDGGFGGDSTGAPVPHKLPDREPDRVLLALTHVGQALIYRLSGDMNPLHADPAVAREAGFNAPILHGLATYGTVGRALMTLSSDGTSQSFRRLDVRFSRPVYPGDTLISEIWDLGNERFAFRTRAQERDVTVLDNGLLEF